MKRVIIGIFILLLFASCETIKISSFVNDSMKISTYKKILVIVDTRDVGFKKDLEKNLVSEFKLNSKTAISSIEIISPLKQYTKSELDQIYINNQIDCVLTVTLLNTSEGKDYITQPIVTPYIKTSIFLPVKYVNATFEILIEDVKTGEIALKATASTMDEYFDNMNGVLKALSKKIVKEYLLLP